ncbi:MAG: hypothetical protein ABII12_17145 [Planctomycetota bacterium]
MDGTPRVISAVVAVLCFCVARASAEPAPLQGNDDDWLRIVPGDVRFYVEMRDLTEVRAVFQKLEMWDTIRELAEREKPDTTTKPWRHTTEIHLGLNPEAAITHLLGQRTALIATQSAQWQTGVVLTELEEASDLRPWLRRWRAKRLANEGPVQRYELRGGLLLAAFGKTLVFGPANDPEGLWDRTVLLLSGRRGPMLAGRADFSALRSRLSRDYPGLLYVAWEEDDPLAFARCTGLLIGISVTADGIDCELRGRRPGREETVFKLDTAGLGALPASTLAVRAGVFDFATFSEEVKSGKFAKTDALLSIFLEMVAGDEQTAGILDNIGPQYWIVIDRDRSELSPLFQLPVVTAICETRAGDAAMAKLDSALGFASQFLFLLSAPENRQPDRFGVKTTVREGVTLHHIEVGPTLAYRSGLDFLAGVDVCWAVVDGRLFLSTSTRHVEEIIRAARGKAARLDSLPDSASLLPDREGESRFVEWSLVRGGEIADVISSWLGFIKKREPDMLERHWWQNWISERLEHHTRLGVGLVADKEHPRRAVVREVGSDSRAAGIVFAGDVVVGVGGAPLRTDQPAKEVAERYRNRGGAREFELQVIRRGKRMTLRIPVLPAQASGLEDFDLIRTLEQLVSLSRRAQVATTWRFAAQADRFDAGIRIKWGTTNGVGQ